MKSPLASLLWRSLRAYQVFGANTDVGKTVFTTLLGRTARKLWSDERVAFLKPVSTGPASEADDRHIHRFAAGVSHKTLFQYDIPVSPHAAAQASGRPIPSDDALLAECRDFAAACAAQGKGWLFLETAGGVHSPSPSGTTQADLYVPLRAPTVLIGDSRLGGISQTISAFESLRLRGYDVESVLVFRDATYQNLVYLADYFRKHHGVPVTSIAEPPERSENAERDADAMAEYYGRGDCEEATGRVLEHLDRRHGERIASLESLAAKAHRHIWYPFTQQGLLGPEDIMTIDSAHGDYFQTLAPAAPNAARDEPLLRSSFDGSASWWTQGLGHSNPQLTLAAAYAAGRYGHVMFAGTVHEPAMALAETLLRGMRNPRLSRVFYSDNGSTGIEVAVKMGLRAARLRYGWGTAEELGVLGLKGGYHGDTMGAMDCAEPCAYNAKIEWYEGKGYWLDYPTVLCSDGKWSVTSNEGLAEDLGRGTGYASLHDIFDVEAREHRGEHRRYEAYITATLTRLQQQGRKFGALILEPIVLGAGGMELVDPLFQRTLVNVVRQSPQLFSARGSAPRDPKDWSGLPVVFDEVFTGLYRLGRFTPSSFLGVHPDISVHAKLLTGGLVPLCTTLASERIFDVFSSSDKTDALLHGHSYTAHPVGCQVALESVREMQAMERRGDWAWARAQGWTDPVGQGRDVWSSWPRRFVEELSQQTGRVTGAWALGSVLAIHLKDAAGAGYSSNAAMGLREALSRGREAGTGGPWNVHARVLGNVLYVMASQTTSETSIRQITGLLRESLAS
ncbi:Bifunctional dethiobiotin synthetase/7,8-diamino-pelargonic acid aminotransferase, mitochondrial [Tolypocladium paradoxum]|uniref:Bifunctional dethiobiotin synthetase/7,8-diamino-pelargonic acid aminotransferase, mitochondrial n=1 Tax=Tolypocladium paradoxum TaxID=94208 RepID=A0A2S4L9T5_9HYPO|nr:Bifunctional dethiobiotin synthetase/7,8-diamino-pelargonic acid aminotransferase, mitochondrial [Tolypocladium paradoxum]